MGTADETIEVGANGDARLHLHLDTILGDGINRGATAGGIRHVDDLGADGSEHGLEDGLVRTAGGNVDSTSAVPVEVEAGLLRSDEGLDSLHDIAARQEVGVDFFDVNRQAGLGRGDLSVNNHGVRHSPQTHADEVEEADLGPRQTGPHPNGEEREQEEDKNKQGAHGDPRDDGNNIRSHSEGKI